MISILKIKYTCILFSKIPEIQNLNHVKNISLYNPGAEPIFLSNLHIKVFLAVIKNQKKKYNADTHCCK